MEILPDFLNELLLHYGSFALLFLLALGIVALPIPEETLLVVSGILIYEGVFSVLPTLFAGYCGSIIGITGSYLIGYTGGVYIIKTYGGYVGITHAKMERVHGWFERYGKILLIVGYFIPGVRHFTGLVAGISSLEYHKFALYAYSGAVFWVSTFLGIGYFFGRVHRHVFEVIESHLELFLSTAILLILLTIVVRVLLTQKKI